VTHWQRLYAPTLRVIGDPFAEEPHWQPSMSNRADPTPEQIETATAQPITAEDLVRAYAEVSLQGVYSLFKDHQTMCVAQGDLQQSSLDALLKSIRSALSFFPEGLKMADLTHGQLREAKSKMLAKMSRRTVKNRMADLRRMLKWFYGSDYGRGHEVPTHFDEVFSVKNATRTDVKPYALALLKALLRGANEREQLYVMLALNCGMYPSDIGRLTLDEINLDQGYVFWDREKEPETPFNLLHSLWHETIRLARSFIQKPGKRAHYNTDYRTGKAEQADCSKLAFVDDKGNMLYRITASGKAYDKIRKAFERLNKRLKKANPKAEHYKFNHLRKSTSQLIRERVGHVVAADRTRMISALEVSNMFLGQKEGLLARLYSQTRELSAAKGIYAVMNQFLGEVGEEMRRAGVFDVIGRKPPTRVRTAKSRAG
jgi:integrase